jgi:Rieske 2Fe-2S family protein
VTLSLVGRAGDRPAFRLPPSAYLDADWLEAEQSAVLGRAWTIVASSADVAEPFDRISVQVGDHPILVLRRPDGTLAAFHNVCRHRGMLLCDPENDEPSGSTVRCPYHGWEWSIEGDLVRVPQRRAQFPDADPAELGLHPASVGEWEGMVFVNAEPDADPLESYLGALPVSIGSYRPGQLVEVGRERIEIEANWKLFVENHIDIYHLWYLHEQSLGAFDHARFAHEQLGPVWVSYEPLRSVQSSSPGALPSVAPTIRHLDERDRTGIGAHMVFPNLLMATTAEFFATYAIHPISPTRSWIDMRVRAEADADGPALLQAVRAFVDEDVVACERVQACMRSSRFAVGPLALDHELSIEQFHEQLLSQLGQSTPRPTPLEIS